MNIKDIRKVKEKYKHKTKRLRNLQENFKKTRTLIMKIMKIKKEKELPFLRKRKPFIRLLVIPKTFDHISKVQ